MEECTQTLPRKERPERLDKLFYLRYKIQVTTCPPWVEQISNYNLPAGRQESKYQTNIDFRLYELYGLLTESLTNFSQYSINNALYKSLSSLFGILGLSSIYPRGTLIIQGLVPRKLDKYVKKNERLENTSQQRYSIFCSRSY